MATNEELVQILRSQVETVKDQNSTFVELQGQNRGFVYNVAKKYFYVLKFDKSIEFSDLMQVGNIALWNAAMTHDAVIAKFSTYAARMIRRVVFNVVVRNAGLVRISTHLQSKIRRIRRMTNEEIGSDVAKSRIDPMMAMLIYGRDPVRIEQDNLEQYSEFAIEISTEKEFHDEFCAIVAQLLVSDILTDREKMVILHHFGLNGHESETTRAIAPQLSISQSMVCLIERKAFQKIRDALPFWEPYAYRILESIELQDQLLAQKLHELSHHRAFREFRFGCTPHKVSSSIRYVKFGDRIETDVRNSAILTFIEEGILAQLNGWFGNMKKTIEVVACERMTSIGEIQKIERSALKKLRLIGITVAPQPLTNMAVIPVREITHLPLKTRKSRMRYQTNRKHAEALTKSWNALLREWLG